MNRVLFALLATATLLLTAPAQAKGGGASSYVPCHGCTGDHGLREQPHATFDPPSENDTYVKSQFGKHIGKGTYVPSTPRQSTEHAAAGIHHRKTPAQSRMEAKEMLRQMSEGN